MLDNDNYLKWTATPFHKAIGESLATEVKKNVYVLILFLSFPCFHLVL